MVHDKMNRITALSTAKAFIDSLCYGNVERRSLFIMERTVADETGPTLLKRHKITHYLLNTGSVHDLTNGFLVDHLSFINYLILPTARVYLQEFDFLCHLNAHHLMSIYPFPYPRYYSLHH